jgi:hypothetical protein
MNFIAVEPVVGGERCLSELDRSAHDGKAGMQIWSADRVDLKHPPGYSKAPARGTLAEDANGQTLTVWLCTETFRNGAAPIIEVSFNSARPHEIGLKTFAAADSRPMSACVLTATMGNWARLRHLELRKGTVEAADLFRGAVPNSMGFFDWHSWGSGDLPSKDHLCSVSATGDLDSATPPDVPKGWKYIGQPAVQTWATEFVPGLEVRVNGREEFWATKTAVPGGPAFENFELYAPFHQGQSFRFSVEPESR